MVPKYRSARCFGVASSTGKSDLQMLHDLRLEYWKKLLRGYLNINSLRNNLHDLRLITHVPIDYFVISETKLDNSFPNAQLTINNYEISAKRDRDKQWGGFIYKERSHMQKTQKMWVVKHRSNLLRSNHLKQKLGHLYYIQTTRLLYFIDLL